MISGGDRVQSRSPTIRVRAKGKLACFSRPEFKVERVSYPVMTPSAARGVVEALLWKPAIRWHIERITLLTPIIYIGFRRNEVNSRIPRIPSRLIEEGGSLSPYYCDSDRSQRNTIALKDVDYLVEAHFTMTEKAGKGDNILKFTEMFQRRLEKGQCFHRPYLGCREFDADVSVPDGSECPQSITQDIGLMLWDIAFSPTGNIPLFFPARLENGIMEIPLEIRDDITSGQEVSS
mgnify:CR=1 FL=1